MASAIGSSSRSRSSSGGGGTAGSTFGAGVVDARQFGAAPAASPTANRTAIQAAYDSLAVAGGKLVIPGGRYALDRTLMFDHGGIRVVGDGPPTILENGPGLYNALIAVGIRRLVSPTYGAPVIGLSTDHLVDCYGIVDSSGAASPGQRWALRTKADHHVTFRGTTLDQPTGGWESVTKLTLDFALDLRVPIGGSTASIMGMSFAAKGTPWFLIYSGLGLHFSWTTSTGVTDPGLSRFVVFQVPGSATTGPICRVTVQVDLAAGTVIGFINKVQVGLSAQTGGSIPAGRKFAPNQYSAFGIGSVGGMDVGTADAQGGAYDTTFYGLKLSRGLLYASNGVGTAQVRLDANPDTDFVRYYWPSTANCFALLPLQEPIVAPAATPATIAADRGVTVLQPAVGSTGALGFFLDNAGHGNPYNNINQIGIESLTLRGGTHGIAYGGCTDVHFRDLYASGSYGIGGLNFGAVNYGFDFQDIFLQGSDSGIYLSGTSQVTMRNINAPSTGRTVIRSLGSLSVDGLKVAGFGNPDCVVYAAGDLLLKNAYVDFEGGDYPSAALIWAVASGAQPRAGMCHIQNLSAGTVGNKAPVFLLTDGGAEVAGGTDGGPGVGRASFRCEGLNSFGNDLNVIVQTNGSQWFGEFTPEGDYARPTYVKATHPTGRNRVVSRHVNFTGSPRDGTWTRDAHRLDVREAADGQFGEWRCVATGSYGTPAPPAWRGINALSVDDSALAAYVAAHTCWTAAGSPAGSLGYWTDYALAAGLNRLFRGDALAPPATLYAGLACWGSYAGKRPNRRGSYAPVIGGGYGRVAVGAAVWNASSGGATSNAVPIAFAASTAAFLDQASQPTTIGALTFHDALTGGNIVAVVEVPPLVVAAAGVVVSFAAGSLALARTPLSLGSLGNAALDPLQNLWLRAAALAPPAVYLALSTAPATLSAGPAEPAGGSYARVATAAGDWLAAASSGVANAELCTIVNANVLAFPAPTGSWGTLRSVYLMDAGAAGNVLAAADLALPRPTAAGDLPRRFAAGALRISLA